jgi:uncharacterized OB-fold protein
LCRRVEARRVAVTNVVRIPVAEGLFTWPDERPRLIGSRHPQTGAVSFPAAEPGAGEEQVLLSPVGTLFTWTTQQFVPPSPPYAEDTDADLFEPYAVGYVELAEGILVEARLTESDPQRLTIGQEMELVVIPFRLTSGTDGAPEREIMTFAFAPVGGAAPAETATP